MIIHISICFSPQYQRQRFFSDFQSASWQRHCATPWCEQRGWTFIENGKLVNQIARLATIVVEFNTPLFRDFYNHLSNYTKTIIIICLRHVNIGEYSLHLQRIIVKYLYSRKPVCHSGWHTHTKLSHSPSFIDKFFTTAVG